MTTDTLPGHEQQPDGITCSSCGRFVGPLNKCPHCGARVNKRLSVHVTRYAAVLLATAGLGLLYLYSVNREIPTIRIGDIKETMNFAYVTIEGDVTSEPRVFKQAGRVRSIRFDIDDGTGEIPVTAYSSQAQALVDAGKVPRLGDHAKISGSLSVSADNNVLMRLQSPAQLTLTAPELPVTAIADISPDLTDPSVLIKGVITAVRAPPANSKAPWTIVVKDDTGEIPVAFWQDIYAEIEEPFLLEPGAAVNVRAGIGSYRGNLQLRMAGGKDIEFTGKADARSMVAGPGAPVVLAQATGPAVSTPRYAPPAGGQAQTETLVLDEVTADKKGSRIMTEGVVREVHDPAVGSKAPTRIIIEDGGTYRMVVYWEKVAQQIGKNKPQVGQRIQVRGDVDVYRDEVQLKVSFSDQIKILSAAAPVAAAQMDVDYTGGPVDMGEPLPAGQVTTAMEGQVVTVQGVLGEPESLRSGVVYPLTDASGTVKIVLWDRLVAGSAREALDTGVTVKVRGPVKPYQGVAQIVPENEQGIAVVQE